MAMCAAEVTCARWDRGLSGPSPAKLEEAGGAVRSGNDGDISLRHRVRGEGDRSDRCVGGLFLGFAE